jgi:hypothetical protein
MNAANLPIPPFAIRVSANSAIRNFLFPDRAGTPLPDRVSTGVLAQLYSIEYFELPCLSWTKIIEISSIATPREKMDRI